MPRGELRKQISIIFPLSEWRALQWESARLKIPMAELCRNWMKGDLLRVRERFRNETHGVWESDSGSPDTRQFSDKNSTAS